MNDLHFFTPVRVIADGQMIELDDVRAALRFLRAWPNGRRGPVYECAVNACGAAIHGQLKTEEARKSLVSFARITRILAESDNKIAAELRQPGRPDAALLGGV